MSRTRQKPPQVDIALPVALLGRAEDFAAGFVIPPHTHDAGQLIHAAAGVMTVETEHGIWVVPPERAVWVPAYVSHSIRMTGAVELRTLYLAASLAPIQGAACCVVQVSPLLRAAILRAVDFSQPYTDSSPEARLVEVILDEIRAAATAPLHLPMPSDPRARKLATAFREQPADRRKLAEWARLAGASERTLERLFRDELGMSFGAWRQQARLLRALEVLAAGESVVTAALEVGFETPSAFIAMFRRCMGTTPAKYFRDAPAAGSTEA